MSDLKDENFQILGQKKDFRWDDANFDCFIHQNIYKNIPMANFFCIATPKSTISYSLNHNILSPKDFYSGFESLKIYDPKNFVNWNERAFNEILNFLQTNKTNVVIVKGIGIFIYEKTLSNLLGLICNIEHSVKILHIYETNKNFHI